MSEEAVVKIIVQGTAGGESTSPAAFPAAQAAGPSRTSFVGPAAQAAGPSRTSFVGPPSPWGKGGTGDDVPRATDTNPHLIAEARAALKGLKWSEERDKRQRSILETEARAALEVVRDRQAAEAEKERHDRSIIEVEARAALAVVHQKQRAQASRDASDRSILEIEARAALEVVRQRQQAEVEQEAYDRGILEVEARASLELVRQKQRAQAEKEDHERSILEIEAHAALNLVRQKQQAEKNKEERERHLLEVEARAALQAARQKQKSISDAVATIVQQLLGLRIPAGTFKGGIWGALLGGVPGSLYAAHRAYKKDGPDAAVGSAGASVATLYLIRQFGEGLSQATRGLFSFAARIISPDASPAAFVETIGKGVKGVSSALSTVVPVVGAFGSVLGGAIEGLGGLMQALDGMVERYARVNPQVAQAKAMADISQTLNDIRRGSELAPMLTEYLQQRTEMQNRFEDFKVSAIKTLMPSLLRMMDTIESFLPLMAAIVDIVNVIGLLVPHVKRDVEDINGKIEGKGFEGSKFIDPSEIIRKGYQEPRGGGRRRTDSGINTPEV